MTTTEKSEASKIETATCPICGAVVIGGWCESCEQGTNAESLYEDVEALVRTLRELEREARHQREFAAQRDVVGGATWAYAQEQAFADTARLANDVLLRHVGLRKEVK